MVPLGVARKPLLESIFDQSFFQSPAIFQEGRANAAQVLMHIIVVVCKDIDTAVISLVRRGSNHQVHNES
jgi:hypothetical protein